MKEEKIMRLKLLEIADKRTKEEHSIHRVLINAKVLMKFIEGLEEEPVQSEGVGCGVNTGKGDENLPVKPIRRSIVDAVKAEQKQKEVETLEDQQLIFKLWFFVVFSPSLADKSFYNLQNLLKDDEFIKQIPVFVRQNSVYVDAVRSIIKQRLDIVQENYKKQKLASDNYFKAETHPRVVALEKYIEEKDKLVKLDVERLQTDDIGDQYILDYISKQNNEQVPFALQQDIKESFEELNDIQFKNLTKTVNQLILEEQSRREESAKIEQLLKNGGKFGEEPKTETSELKTPSVPSEMPTFKDDVVFGEEVGKDLSRHLLLKSDQIDNELIRQERQLINEYADRREEDE